MKILIACDMEGISGVVNWKQATAGESEYERCRKIMTEEINAAIRGACEGGADEVIVADGHASGNNLLVEMLDQRARLNSGSPSPLSMVQGIGPDVDGVLFIGYHARIGSQNAILEHTWSSATVAGVWVNGVEMGEYGLNAAVCGHFGVPVLMISGDQVVCEQARQLLGPLETVVVKTANGRFSAECLPPLAAQAQIQATAQRAVAQRKNGAAQCQPFRPSLPVHMAVEFFQTDMAERAHLLPGCDRTSARRIEWTSPDFLAAYRAFRAAVGLARP